MKPIIILVFFLAISCKKESVKQSLTHYDEVENYLETEDFGIDETTDTSASSFITSARYQSENGVNGYLTLGMRGHIYYFSEVPLEVWERLKDADSKGAYYHQHIEGKYTLDLNK